jgi:rubredoxin
MQRFIVLLFLAIAATVVEGFAPSPRFMIKNHAMMKARELSLAAVGDNNIKITEYIEGEEPETEDVKPVEVPDLANETPEEKYKREKLAEIAERKAQEVFITRNTGKWECQACGYIYEESKGNAKYNVAPGTPFPEIEKFRCPQVRHECKTH